MPAGFQNGDVASSATAVNAPPMATARAPTGIFMNSPAYFVAPAGTTATARPAMASSTRIRFSSIQLPGVVGLAAIPARAARGRETGPARIEPRSGPDQLSTGRSLGFHSGMLASPIDL